MITPRWLDALEKKIGWFSLPNMALYIILFQVFGFLVMLLKPQEMERLILDPQAVLNGEIWRTVTFISMPLSGGFWFIIAILFLYFIINSLESYLGEFKTTFYIFISLSLTVAFALIFNVIISDFTLVESTLFLAVATLFPEVEIMLFFIFPVKLKWMGIIGGGFILLQFFLGNWLYRIYIIIVFSNYFLFFGPHFINMIKQRYRRAKFNRDHRS